MGAGVGEQVRKLELDAYQAFLKVTAVTGMSWVSATSAAPSSALTVPPNFSYKPLPTECLRSRLLFLQLVHGVGVNVVATHNALLRHSRPAVARGPRVTAVTFKQAVAMFCRTM